MAASPQTEVYNAPVTVAMDPRQAKRPEPRSGDRCHGAVEQPAPQEKVHYGLRSSMIVTDKQLLQCRRSHFVPTRTQSSMTLLRGCWLSVTTPKIGLVLRNFRDESK